MFSNFCWLDPVESGGVGNFRGLAGSGQEVFICHGSGLAGSDPAESGGVGIFRGLVGAGQEVFMSRVASGRVGSP